MLQNLFLFAAALFGFLWFSALLGEERRSHDTATAAAQGSEHALSLRQDLKLVWHSRTMRYFLAYLTLSMFFAFSQDAILEPFGGDVFGMSASVTNRFAAYWGVTAIVGTILFLVLSRRYPRLTTTLMAQAGAGVLVLAFVLLAAAALLEVRALVTPGLIVMGVGLGVWNVGTLGLMMALSPAGRAGTFLGFWTMAVTLARGGGTTAGGIVRDVGLALSGQMGVAYGSVFAFGAVGLLVSMWALSRVHIRKFKAAPVDSAGVFAGAMD
jgi:BCD family chlorophyll transporter-like MFS transporter